MAIRLFVFAEYVDDARFVLVAVWTVMFLIVTDNVDDTAVVVVVPGHVRGLLLVTENVDYALGFLLFAVPGRATPFFFFHHGTSFPL
jgi:hypothetical protein